MTLSQYLIIAGAAIRSKSGTGIVEQYTNTLLQVPNCVEVYQSVSKIAKNGLDVGNLVKKTCHVTTIGARIRDLHCRAKPPNLTASSIIEVDRAFLNLATMN